MSVNFEDDTENENLVVIRARVQRELVEKVKKEAQKRTEEKGRRITVSDLIRGGLIREINGK